MEVLEAILTRRSVRDFTTEEVTTQEVALLLEAARWAPSGLNNQPWRFAVVRDGEIRRDLAALTKYHRIVEQAPVVIALFIDQAAMYSDVKDHQAIGACIQNILLAAHGQGLGAVWLGEILKNGEQVRELLGLAANLELMAVVAVGRPALKERRGTRREVQDLLVAEFW